MSIEYVCQMFDWIESVSSRKEKVHGLRTLAHDVRFSGIAKEMLSIALDWYRRFHIATLADEYRTHPRTNVPEFFDLCKQLESGELKPDEDIIQSSLSKYSARVYKWMRRCLLKDLRMGVAESTVNSVWPGLISTFECQLADTLGDLETLAYPVFVEEKIDGVRCIAIAPNGYMGKIDFLSRGGQVLHNLSHVENDLRSAMRAHGITSGVVFDGEAFYQSLKKTMSIVRTFSKIPNDSLEVRYHIFDIIPLIQWNMQQSSEHLTARKNFLNSFHFPQGSCRVIPSTTASNAKDVEDIYVGALKAGHEGVMIKNPHGFYVFDRSKDWLKYKPEDTDVFPIIGSYEGDNRNAFRLGGLTVQSSGAASTDVGGGFTDADRCRLWTIRDQLVGKLVRVKFKERTSDGKLREPVFIGFEE